MGSKTKIKKGARGTKGEKGKEKKAKVKSKIRKVVKRSGEVVPFNQKKITEAVYKAFCETREAGKKEAKQVSDKLVQLLNKNFKPGYIPQIEEIQDLVEKVLMILDFDETAKAYIIYRDKRGKLRDTESSLSEAVDLIESYIKEIDWQVKENANMAYSLQGLNNYVSSIVSSKYWMDRVYPKSIKRAHEEGDFHIHDLDKIAAYCCGWDLQDLLTKGFTGVSGKISCKPPKHLRTAIGQMVNFFYTLQGEVAGAEAFSNFDTLLAPFVRFDGLSFKDVKQCMQEFVFNVNVPTRVGFQTPFTNITLDIVPPKNMADESVIIGGVPQKEKYGEFQEEMNMINKAFAEVMAEGDANGRVFTFPIPTYNITRNFNWDDDHLKPVWEMTAKYGIPYFANFINSDMDPEDARSMCCRLRIDNRELHKRGGGLFGSNPLTGSIGVITINMPRIGYLSDTEEAFMERLQKLMTTAKESLEIKRKVLEKFTDGNLYPYTKYYLRNVKQRFNEYWKNHFSTIGLVGMNEACLNLLGQNITTPEGQRFAKEVIDFMRNRMGLFQTETGNNYNLESTPAEGTSYRLARSDKRKYPDIVCANEENYLKSKAEPFYTNSTQLPVNFTDDVFEALDLQDDIQTKYTGGTVFHTYAGERISDPGAVKSLVRKICENYHLPYLTFTPTFSICPSHGYLNGESETCPACHERCEVYSRVVGYLRPVKQWNNGKKEEFK